MAKRYARHRNYRLSDQLLREIETYAQESNITESEAVRRLLYTMMIRLNDPSSRNLSPLECNASEVERRQ